MPTDTLRNQARRLRSTFAFRIKIADPHSLNCKLIQKPYPCAPFDTGTTFTNLVGWLLMPPSPSVKLMRTVRSSVGLVPVIVAKDTLRNNACTASLVALLLKVTSSDEPLVKVPITTPP